MSIARAEQDLARLQREISRLDAELTAARERATKIAHYIEMAREYQNVPEGTALIDGILISKTAPRLRAAQGGMSGAAVRETIDILRESGRPVHTRELLPILEQRGIKIGGANPLTNLSGYLSRSDDLIADRSRGWRLKEWEGAELPAFDALLTERPPEAANEEAASKSDDGDP
jgi:hypothetical protein